MPEEPLKTIFFFYYTFWIGWGKLEPFVRLLLLSMPPLGKFYTFTPPPSRLPRLPMRHRAALPLGRIAKSNVLVFPLYGRAVLPMEPVVELLALGCPVIIINKLIYIMAARFLLKMRIPIFFFFCA